eukprot:CAMPEP_0202340406 /NCGR_PEP_ID=MMETSP1126-20121109/1860_1 /ASSEMBLY_ACC=CAM_ASM_000457 /TAXON_ID=3047 /ORGANISM="Dunaliella tertiolecta, Strain CCMP1320" /LENGTH=93 /DNA_ID=CAMNT_0048931109 /DNA_START=945 /DNA_END=1226 /DNA_ORIENTATION=+
MAAGTVHNPVWVAMNSSSVMPMSLFVTIVCTLPMKCASRCATKAMELKARGMAVYMRLTFEGESLASVLKKIGKNLIVIPDASPMQQSVMARM